ncbi:hypothetical protein DERP_005287 [Dermatophagoides pteronyssinus]|uniref:Uncharacterized protein n=1 Tax=Dermatophagoides pteronyssinus TaxID=6956 RepID=A0ABQ8JM54_DERPT|nr:hypothetical protein DERP_005287 [Dermatophagoides pteronyssinus]
MAGIIITIILLFIFAIDISNLINEDHFDHPFNDDHDDEEDHHYQIHQLYQLNNDLFVDNNNFNNKQMKKILPHPNIDDNNIKIIIDDHQRKISLLFQHISIKPFIAYIQYDNFIFVCDERRIYITTIRTKFYNPLGIYNDFKIIYEDKFAPDLTDLAIDFYKKRLFFLNVNGEIGYFNLCPQIRFGDMIKTNNLQNDYKHDNTLLFLFVDNINQKLLWGDENQIIKCETNGDNVELVHKFGYIQLSTKLDSRPMDIDGDCLYWNDRNSLYKLTNNGQMNRLLDDPRFITNKIKVVDDGKYVYFLSMGNILYRLDLSERRPKFNKILELIDKNFTISSFDIIIDSYNDEWCPIKSSYDYYNTEEHESIWNEIVEIVFGRRMDKFLAVLIINTLITILTAIAILIYVYKNFYHKFKPPHSNNRSIPKIIDDNNNNNNNNNNNDDTINKLSGIEQSSSIFSPLSATMTTITNTKPMTTNRTSFLSQQQQQQQPQQPQQQQLTSTNPKMSIQL